MIKLIVTDLDNTLYDWVGYYVPAFNAMLAELRRESGVSERDLLQSFKRVHQRHGTSEYAFALEELDVLADRDGPMPVEARLAKYHNALAAFREARRRTLHLYEGVVETLTALRNEGRKIVAHTDAMMFYASHRTAQLGLDPLLDAIFAPANHDFPVADWPSQFHLYDVDRQPTTVPTRRVLRTGVMKPDPRVLFEILDEFDVEPDEAVYVGDSLGKDIALAQGAGVHDVYAEYGSVHDPGLYERLVDITHWTSADVERERSLAKKHIVPSHRIGRFSELPEVVCKLDHHASPSDTPTMVAPPA